MSRCTLHHMPQRRFCRTELGEAIAQSSSKENSAHFLIPISSHRAAAPMREMIRELAQAPWLNGAGLGNWHDGRTFRSRNNVRISGDWWNNGRRCCPHRCRDCRYRNFERLRRLPAGQVAGAGPRPVGRHFSQAGLMIESIHVCSRNRTRNRRALDRRSSGTARSLGLWKIS